MAPNVPAPNTVQAVIEYQLDTSGTEDDTRFWQNSVYFERISGGVDFGNATALAIALADWWGEFLSPRLPARVLGRQIAIYDLTTVRTLVQFRGLFLSPGGSPFDPMPLNVALRIEFVTGVPGRAFRGNNTISGVPTNYVRLNKINELWATGIVAVYQLLLPLAADHGWNWVVCSRSIDGAPRSSAVNTPVINCEFADLDVDSWRGRLNNRGF